MDKAGLCNRVALCTIHSILVLKLDQLLLLVDKNIVVKCVKRRDGL